MNTAILETLESKDIKLKMRSMFSAAELEELQTLFQDY